jgi:hypothetical protein
MTVPVGPGGPEAADAEPARRESASSRGDGGPLDRPDPMRLRGFIPVEELQAVEVAREGTRRRKPRGGTLPGRTLPGSDESWVAGPPPVAADTLGGVDDWEKRVSLFGEAEG